MSFITWYPTCRRSDTIAQYLGGNSHLIHYLGFKQPIYAPVKYVIQTAVSWWKLIRERPDYVFVAAPPTVAALAIWMYCAVLRRKFVIDAHTGNFDDPRWTWLESINAFLARKAATNIVTNAHLQNIVREWGGMSHVIGDVPVEFEPGEPAELGPGEHVVVVNTFSVDEPLQEILQAARSLPDVTFHVTGNLKHARQDVSDSVPDNVTLTGWLTEEGYAALLRAASAVVCLTNNDHTMQRGGYEAMALGKPLITSDWSILKDTFSAGTVHIDNSTPAIRDAITSVVSRQDELGKEMKSLYVERRKLFESRISELSEFMKSHD